MDKRVLEIEKTSPTLITGCARSGTSMVAGVINICGSFGGKLSSGNTYNPKGMFENAYIRDHVEKPYLKSIGKDPLGQYPLPEMDTLTIPVNWKDTVHNVMLKDGYQGPPWYYKSAKACLIWPVWNYAFPNAKWIIVRRRSADIAESCLSTAFMQKCANRPVLDEIGKETPYDGWIWWINQHEKRFVEMISAGLNVKQIWPDRWMNGNYEQLKETIEWLGLEWKHDEVIDFVDKKLWKTRGKHK